MTKNELIGLLKELKENKAKILLNQKDIRKYKKDIERISKKEINYYSVGNKDANRFIKSKGMTSDSVGNKAINIIDKKEEEIKQLENKIRELEEENTIIYEKIEEAEIRLNALYYKDREILTAYYVENRTADDISQNFYFEKFKRTVSERYIRDVIEKATRKMLNL